MWILLYKLCYLFVLSAAPGPQLLNRAFSSCARWRLLFVVVCKLLTAVSSLVAENGLQGKWTSAVAAHQLGCPLARGIFPDQGSNLCPLCGQVESQLLDHQGSPVWIFWVKIWNEVFSNRTWLMEASDCLFYIMFELCPENLSPYFPCDVTVIRPHLLTS